MRIILIILAVGGYIWIDQYVAQKKMENNYVWGDYSYCLEIDKKPAWECESILKKLR